jgi:N-acetylglucosamine malate deacetylase 1
MNHKERGKSMKQLMDYMAIGAHPDDVELHAGGTLVKMTSEGKKGVIVDMTRADAATRGTPELRLQEAAKAGRILGIAERINLGLPDSQLQVNPETILKVVKVIRQYRPKIILTHSQDDYHPDHVATCEIVKRAWYMSGLKRVLPEYEAYRPKRLFHFIGAVSLQPRFCIDITPFLKLK